jgi:hypothetical protein
MKSNSAQHVVRDEPRSNTLRRFPQEKLREAWCNPAAFATSLLVLYADMFAGDPEAFEWDPQTIALELADELHDPIPETNFDRLMAAIMLVTTDLFYTSLPDFVNLCSILNGVAAHAELWNPTDAVETAWGITEGVLIYPPDTEEVFSDDIRRYIGAVLNNEGIIQPPDVLKIGIRDDVPAESGPADFTDDPILFNSIYKFEGAKTEEVNRVLHEGLLALGLQLQSLPLREGDASNLVQRILRSVR